MQCKLLILVLALNVSGGRSQGQPVISSGDLFNQPGLYYRAHANSYNPMDITGGTAYVVPSNLIGSAGANQFWDFSAGPTDRIMRFDYMTPTGLAEAAEFPEATVAEQMTDESNGSRQWLFFEQVPGSGRKVYGFYAVNPLFTPSNVFLPPIVDFPSQISFGQEWTTATTYRNTLSITDPDPEEGGMFEFAQRVTHSSSFKVDAHGTIVLPDPLAQFGPALRINEEVIIDIAIDFGEGQFQHVDTSHARNYYWVMPGYGIVAQLNSTQSSSPQPERFARATSFLRMFETNKKPAGGGCAEPEPVANFRIRVNNGSVLLTWTAAACASTYRVEYAKNPATGWLALGEPTSNTFWLGESVANGSPRFYRVVSIK